MVDLKALSAICGQCVELASRTPPSLWIISLLSTFTGFILFGYTLLILVAPRPRPPLPPEKRYKTIAQDGSITEPQLLPCWQDSLGNPTTDNTKEMEKAELFMSVVVPAFNEEERLGGMLEEAVNYLERTYGKPAECQQDGTLLNEVTKCERTRRRKLDGDANGTANRSADMPVRGWEILVVSDGSTDGTVETALAFAKDHQLSPHPKSHPGPWSTVVDAEGVHTPPGTIRVITLTKNRGKGGAVTHGMRHVRGQYVIFADADGASRFDDLGKLVSACQRIEDVQSRGLAVGSRAHLVGSEAVVKRSKLRNFLMHSFHLILRILTPPATASIKDTQCGFKLFSRASLPYIIPYMHSEGWIFDVEMLMLAEFAGIPVAEVPVGWREVKGSKLNVVWDSLGMAWGLAILRMAWGFGVYRRT
ncbi:dolichyl-phosphate beta-glucosyltransferase [Histoplasma capsulatum]|uniref:dolichyl-phosphate beta-glucosyltransferase n=1 Tax=Ajellomyces capsulatus TaxID=5037 RepID=A0A8A1LZA6_AJECA|nr:dolichyl-phosphate beta-glucosyltransferase [Histoplasma mississippiense (nom. inval.)]EDN04736.1 dolichyl-phosphate beta-glucosyltransferase [Histoplasma mississippiense (nom. inval.)]QSS59528.1 dolichyl-phosphate beta-glucosyltransferase [Histoplasma capsulatum]